MNIKNLPEILHNILIDITKNTLTTDISFKDVNVYSVVPRDVSVPYVKIGDFIKDSQPLYSDNSFRGIFKISVFSSETNFISVSQIVNYLKILLPENAIGKVKDGVEILNVIIGDYSIQENMDLRSWIATFTLTIVAKLLE